MITRQYSLCLLLTAFITLGASALGSDRPPIPIQVQSNLVLLQASVNGSGPLTFILDSAARNCSISAARARELGLSSEGAALASGTGGDATVSIHHGVQVRIGDVVLKPEIAISYDMGPLSKAIGTHVDGIIGRHLLEAWVAEIDYPHRSLRLVEARSFAYAGEGQRIPIEYEDGVQVIRGKITADGRGELPGTFLIDTGSSHVLVLTVPFTDKHDLLKVAGELTPSTGLGIGGASNVVVGRLKHFQLGRFAVDDPVVRFSRHDRGLFAQGWNYSGDVGGGFFKDYKLILDYLHSQIILEKSGT